LEAIMAERNKKGQSQGGEKRKAQQLYQIKLYHDRKKNQ